MQRSLDRLGLRTDISRALDNGELSLAYQPIVDLASSEIVSFEALLRWNHPERGPIPPSTFFPLAEETGAMVAIGRWVIGEACRQLAIWKARRSVRPLSVAVNVSGIQLRRSEIIGEVTDALRATGLEPADLWLEITEDRDVPDQAIEQLVALHGAGIRLALDDFGIFHSNLSLLQRFPVDSIKIDQSFVAGLSRERVDRGIVHAIVALGRALEVRVVAEGIETVDQRDELVTAGCRFGQGYLFSPPVSGTLVEGMLPRDEPDRRRPAALRAFGPEEVPRWRVGGHARDRVTRARNGRV